MDFRALKELCQRLDELAAILEIIEGELLTSIYIARHPTR